MNAVPATVTAAAPGPPPGRRADAGSVRLGGRDVAGLLLCGDMYGGPYDLLLPTSLSDDQAAPLHEHGSAAVDDHGADCSAVLADPDSAIYCRVKW